jgi:nicotinamidase-related amidase
MSLNLDPAKSALLVMDFQVPIVENYAPGKEQLLDRTETVLKKARATGMQVMYVVVGFRPGFPEISPRNQTFSGLKARGGLDSTIHPRVTPVGDEPVVTKHRVGAFFGTDLDMLLRAKDVETLVFAGISTGGVVLSTLRHAADADYRLVVLRDCCADPDTEVHACLLDKVFPRQASVIDSKGFLAALSG